ncbi:MAG: hypothetical protein ACREH5_00060 [Candidatus Omnitrophota bacterium]
MDKYRLLKSKLVFLVLSSAFLVQQLAWADREPDRTESAAKKAPAGMQSVDKVYDLEKYLAFKQFSFPPETAEQKKKRQDDPKAQFDFIRKQLGVYEKALRVASRKMNIRQTKIFEKTGEPSPVEEAADLSSPLVPFAPVRLSKDEIDKACRFLSANLTPGGMPLSFQVSPQEWEKWESAMDPVDSVMERLILAHSLSIYDAAIWQIALAITDDEKYHEAVDNHTRRLISGQSGDLQDIRAHEPFRYGDKRVKLDRENAYFFRIIAETYDQQDPKTGLTSMPEFPNLAEFHHEDWKPITGEQAWAAIIGPLQLAYIQYGGKIPANCKEVRLALSILPAIEAMRSRIGAIYHAPLHTHGKEPNDISNENNFSLYAALKMLYAVVKDEKPGAARRIHRILRGQEEYFRYYAFDEENEIFYQGGFYVNGRFIPTRIFTVDCQTWATIVLGPQWIDEQFGDGTAYRIWQNTKRHAGYFDRGAIRGVGFTDGHRILSAEWTCGAILAARTLSRAYENWYPAWARECADDAASMRYGVEEIKVTLGDGSVAYWYANRRSFIPFGWWANPIPSLVSTAWVVLIDREFNPFILGGGPYFEPAPVKHPPDYL